jgi:N-acetylneuraminic acid mutarotase
VTSVPGNLSTTTSGTVTEVILTGLSNETAYVFNVSATNGSGRGPASEASNGVTPTEGSSCADATPAPWTGFTWRTSGDAQPSPPAPAPVVRIEGQGAVVGGKLYACGGYTFEQCGDYKPDPRCHVYDIATNQWSSIADMPKAVSHGAVAHDDNHLYVAGGYPDDGGCFQVYATKDVWKYDIGANQWTPLPALPEARGSGGLVLLGRQLHFFGGVDEARQEKQSHWMLDLDAPGAMWIESTPIPQPRSHPGYASLNGKIYSIGGQVGIDDNGVHADVLVWDPLHPDSWVPKAPLPTGRGHIAGGTFVAEGRIVVMGGINEAFGTLTDVLAYDPSANSWSASTPLPAARQSGIGGFVDGKIVYSGGADASSFAKNTTIVGTLQR